MRFLRRVGSYIGGILTALSQVGNSLAAGSPKQTLSARLGHSILRGNRWAKRLCAIISMLLLDLRHCEKEALRALERDRKKALDCYGPFAMDIRVMQRLRQHVVDTE